MRRRQFIALLGAAAAVWPVAARAQPVRRMPRIGVIDDAANWDHFRQGLRDLGYVERQNIAIEYRSAQDNVDQLSRAALELASLPTDVIVVHGSPATRAARRATATIPIVTIEGLVIRSERVLRRNSPGRIQTSPEIRN